MKISKFATSKDAEADGVWVDAGDGLRLKICRAKNARFKEMAMKLSRPHLRAIQANRMNVKQLEDIDKRVYAKTIIRGWKDMQDDDGKDIPFSETKALELLRELPMFYELVQDLCTDASVFQEEAEEVLEENLKAS